MHDHLYKRLRRRTPPHWTGPLCRKPLVAAHPDRYDLFYNQERGLKALAGLEHLLAHTVILGYKPCLLGGDRKLAICIHDLPHFQGGIGRDHWKFYLQCH